MTTTLAHTPNRARVLIVGEDFAARAFYRDVLESAGFEVSEATTGGEGIGRVLVESFNLLIVEANPPRMDSHQVIGIIRQHETLWHVPVITIGIEDQARSGRQAGVNFNLIRPVDPDALEQMARLLTGTTTR